MDTQDDIDITARILKYGYCGGYHCRGKGIPQEDHTCPFASEIQGDDTTLCNCCETCEHECAMDI